MQDKQYPHTCDVYSLSKYIQTSDERGCFPIAFREIYQISNIRIKQKTLSIYPTISPIRHRKDSIFCST